VAFIPIYDGNPLRHIRRPWVAWGIIATNVFVFFFVEFGRISGDAPIAASVAYGLIPAVFNGFVDRPIDLAGVPAGLTLVTYAFLHGSFWHLAGNMIFLWVFGDNIEDALGHFRYFVFYILCAAVAGYAYVLSDPTSQVPVIGASGAVGGNIAAYLLLHPRAKIAILLFLSIPLRLSAMYVLGFWIVFQILAALGGGGGEVAWWSHVGGLVAGGILVIFMRRRGVPLFDRGPAAPTVRGPWG
jgi:membrane associated rhomboid family serine protease